MRFFALSFFPDIQKTPAVLAFFSKTNPHLFSLQNCRLILINIVLEICGITAQLIITSLGICQNDIYHKFWHEMFPFQHFRRIIHVKLPEGKRAIKNLNSSQNLSKIQNPSKTQGEIKRSRKNSRIRRIITSYYLVHFYPTQLSSILLPTTYRKDCQKQAS